MALNINGTTGISGVDGSVSAPALTGTDSNTGITFPAADTIKFATGGVERMSITNSGVSGITAGITMVNQWRLTTSATITTSATYLTANFEQVDTDGYGNIGSNMTESGGIFTFPSTGVYLVRAIGQHVTSGGSVNWSQLELHTTTNNSTYNLASVSYASIQTDGGYQSSISEHVFDVTDVSTHKVRFRTHSHNSNSVLEGNSGYTGTSFLFLRLGDT